MMMDELADQLSFSRLEILLRGAAFLSLSQRIRQRASAMAEYIQLGAGLDHEAGDEGLVSDAGVRADHQPDGLVHQGRPESGRRRDVVGHPVGQR